jgi:homoserine kinase
MHDRLHEPYRARLFPHLQVLIAAARGAGALGACLSGAGPAVLALTDPNRTESVAAAFRTAAAGMGVAGEVRQLGVAPAGAEIIDESGRVTRPAEQLDAR